ncbi:MAG: protein kinase [Candidatus Aminicenantes bacterium]|nr:protein kinase [Candidatus Aminicenantes bacterium]
MGIKCPKCQTDNPDTQKFCGECATPLPASKEIPVTETLETPKEELTRGTTFANRYEIIEELGKGGMGKVYRVEDKKIKEELALKLIKPEISSDKKTIERFSNELKMAHKVSHRNVCRMYHLSEEKGTYFITMEYVPGEDLKSFIKRAGPLGVGKTIFIAKQVCEGLAEAHRLGVMHRDLKPQNIMVDKEGNARVMDFGIARSLTAKGITGAGVMVGTPEYMSPEQAELKEVDQRSDIYSLGVILYEMVTGRVPFEGETPLGIAMKHKSEMPKDPKEINAQIPEDLSQMILKCMEKDKMKRYQNAGEVCSELTKIEKGIPTTEIEVPKRKPITSREITVTFGLKKLFIPTVSIVALAVIGVLLWQAFFRKGFPPSAPLQRSVAVLPFIDLSPQKDHEWLSDGISEAMINALSSLKGLRVPARTSSFFFKGKELNIQEVGQKLKVENVLEGSVQVAGDALRVNAQLISVKDGYQLWSDKFDRRLEDVFSIQDEIAREIVRALKVRLLGEEEIQLTKKYTENLEAYNFYLQGRYFWKRRGREDLYKSIEYYEKALEKDPNYVLAYAGLSDSYSTLASPPEEVYPKAREFALKALEIDNRLAQAHTALAHIKKDYDRDWTGAEEEYKIALQLNPDYAYAHHWYAFLLSAMGRLEEAIKEIKTARDLDPLAPEITANVGVVLYFARKYDQALEEHKKAIELYPEYIGNYTREAEVYTALGRYEEALASLQRYEEITGAELITRKAYNYAKWGKKKEAEKLLKKIIEESEKTYISSTSIARIYGVLGDFDQAFSLLEKAYSKRDHDLQYLKVHPTLDSLRSDPRFKTLLKRMNLD